MKIKLMKNFILGFKNKKYNWDQFLMIIFTFTLPQPAPFQPTYNPDMPKNLLTQGLNWFFVIMSFLCIAVIVWAGVTYATAGGNEDKVQKAKSRLIYALIGITIVISAYAIIQLIKSLAQGNIFPSPTF